MPTRRTRRAHGARRDQLSQPVGGLIQRGQARHGTPAIGNDHLAAFTHLVKVTTQVVLEVPDADFDR